MFQVRVCDSVVIEVIRVELEFYKDCRQQILLAASKRQASEADAQQP
jgi:hypothetical protein